MLKYHPEKILVDEEVEHSFLTEEICERTAGPDAGLLAMASWPQLSTNVMSAEATAEMDWVVRLISQIRTVRAEVNVPAGAKVPMVLHGPSIESERRLKTHHAAIVRLARLEGTSVEPASASVPDGSAQIVLEEAMIVLPLAGIIDLAAEKTRLKNQLEKVLEEISGIDFDRRPEQLEIEEFEKLLTNKTKIVDAALPTNK